jgi:outer membrane immunogenic protein
LFRPGAISVKKQLLLGTAFGALAAASPAIAAPPAPVATIFNWTGFYIGINAGYSSGNGDHTYAEPAFACCGLPTVFSGSQSLNGGLGGFHGGYNYQGGSWLVGLESDFDWTGEKGSDTFSRNYSFTTFSTGFEGAVIATTTTGNLSGTVNAGIEWFGTVRGRFGWLVNPTTLLYGTGGLAYGRVNVSGRITDTACAPACTWSFATGQTQTGYAVGAGVEGTIPNFPKVFWRLEYLYVDLGTVTGSGFDTDFGGRFSWSQRVTDNIWRAGVSLKIP